MGRIELACGSDAAFLPHVATMIHSALAHAGGREVRVHYLHGPDLGPANAERLRAMVEERGGLLALHEVTPDRIANLAEPHFAPRMTWYRVFAPDLLGADVDRVLYVDADAVVMDDLAPLWDTPLGDHYVAAVTNVFTPWDLGYPRNLRLAEGAYFNGGVLLMNLAAMRADAVGRRMLEYGETAPPDQQAFGDQCALNALMSDRRLALHPRWNAMNSLFAFEHSARVFPDTLAAAKARPGIRHFEGPGPNKPWHPRCRYPHRDAYARHRQATPWARRRVERALARLQSLTPMRAA